MKCIDRKETRLVTWVQYSVDWKHEECKRQQYTPPKFPGLFKRSRKEKEKKTDGDACKLNEPVGRAPVDNHPGQQNVCEFVEGVKCMYPTLSRDKES